MLSAKRYAVQMLAAFALYGLVLVPSIRYLKNHPETGWTLPIAVAPFLPVLGIAWVAIRAIRSMDEMQRRIQSDAVVTAFIISALGAIAYGFLQNAGFPPVNLTFVGTSMIGVWGLSVLFSIRRYD